MIVRYLGKLKEDKLNGFDERILEWTLIPVHSYLVS